MPEPLASPEPSAAASAASPEPSAASAPASSPGQNQNNFNNKKILPDLKAVWIIHINHHARSL